MQIDSLTITKRRLRRRICHGIDKTMSQWCQDNVARRRYANSGRGCADIKWRGRKFSAGGDAVIAGLIFLKLVY
jgi:hypothetical protein